MFYVRRPICFRKDFHWYSQPDDLWIKEGDLSPLFCGGTPVTPKSFWASLFLTILTYTFGLAVTPIWPFSWWLGNYLWFSSIYYQCLAVFPLVYNYLHKRLRKNIRLSLLIIIVLFFLTQVHYALFGMWEKILLDITTTII